MSGTKVHIEVTPEQADHISRALEVYTRLGIGQIETIDDMWRMGEISKGQGHQFARGDPTLIESLCSNIKQGLGHPPNGSNGICNPHNTLAARSCWEIKKNIDKLVSFHRNPNPKFRGVNYDGLSFRLTNLPEPVTYILTSETEKENE